MGIFSVKLEKNPEEKMPHRSFFHIIIGSEYKLNLNGCGFAQFIIDKIGGVCYF